MSIIDDLKAASGETSGAPGASAVPAAGAALPPAQGGPSFSDTEMRTLSGGGRPSPYRAPAAKPAQETAQPFDLGALRKEIDADLSSLGTREALDEALSGLGDLAAPAEEEPHAPAPVQPAAQTQDAPAAIGFSHTFDTAPAKKFRESAVRRIRDRLSGVRRTGKPMSDDAASADPETFKFPTLEDLDASVPLPW